MQPKGSIWALDRSHVWHLYNEQGAVCGHEVVEGMIDGPRPTRPADEACCEVCGQEEGGLLDTAQPHGVQLCEGCGFEAPCQLTATSQGQWAERLQLCVLCANTPTGGEVKRIVCYVGNTILKRLEQLEQQIEALPPRGPSQKPKFR